MKKCYETGQELPPTMKDTARFSSDAARANWNNRLKLRGSELYNLLMIWRYERPLAKKLKVISLICSMLARWHAEDKEIGRTSYLPVEEVLARHGGTPKQQGVVIHGARIEPSESAGPQPAFVLSGHRRSVSNRDS